MKKIFKLFSVLVILPIGFLLSAVVFQNSNSAAALGGEGTLQNPYTIGSAEDLLQFAQYINNNALPYSQADKHFVLTADINLSNYGVSYNGGKGWVPIGTIDKPFKGNFDGNGHKISGLYIHNYNLDCAGLFGGVGIGVVKDFALLNVNINAKSNVGGVVGLLEAYGKIEGCYVTGTVNGINYFIGGIAGSVNDSTVINCYTTCDINGKDDAGGIAGSIYNSTISNCYATGNIDVTDDGVGGIAAYVTGSAKIENCVALNLTVSGDYDGRILGRGNGTLINNYALSILKDKNGETSSWTNKGTNQKDGADVNTADCLTALFWTGSSVGWDTNVWNVQNGRLPELLKIGGTGTVPEHLKTDILSATVVVTPGTYAYTGSIILPQNMSVTLDGKALTQSQDYTYSITSTDGGGASAGKNTGIVTITISGDGAYKGTVTKTYTIVKANPTYTAPSDLTAVYGDNLSSVILPAGFTFESAGLVGNEGANIFYVTFTPSDIVNYNIVNNIAVTVTVGRKAIAVPNAINGLVYTGAEQTGVNAGAGYTVTFGAAVNAGTYYATVTPNDNYEWNSGSGVTSERVIEFNIAKANPIYTVPAGLTAVYGDNLSSVILPEGFTFESAGLVGNEGANIFYVTFTPSDIVNYNIVNNIAVTVTVGRKAIAVPNAINGLVYTGAEQTGVNAGAGYTVTFGVAVNAGTYYAMVTLDGNHKWDSVNDVTSERIVKFNIAKVNPAYTVPTGLEAVYGDNLSSVILPAGFIFESAGLVGSEGANIFYVTFTPSDIVNYNIVNNIAVTVTVGRKAIAVPNAINGLVYTGAEQTGVNAGAGYTVTFGAAVNAGTYYATVTLDGNHKWNSVNDVTSERVIEFNIAKANPAYTVPTGLEAVYGDNLSSVILPEGFTFESEGLVGNEGANIFYATFTPSDIVNYNIITGIEITVMVKSDVKEPVEPPTTTGPTTPTEPTKPLEPTSPSGGPDNDANSIVWIIIGIIAGSFTVLLGYAILKRKLKSSKTKSQKAET